MSIQEIPTLRLERELADGGAELIVGFDEVGRGSLAGPVMVGAAMIRACDLPSLDVPDGVADSKMLTERRREAIYDELKSWCASWAVGSASNTEIDEWGISHALGVAALRALAEAERKLGLVAGSDGTDGGAVRVAGILDGPNDYITKTLDTFDAPDVPAPARITTLVKADRHCATVATAAVIAKVTRDWLMVDLAQAHPEWAPYEWEHNKGYGSVAHRAAIVELGPTPLHRVSWKLT